MESEKSDDHLHILFFPFMPQGHFIPVIHMAKLFASRGHRSTITATSHFAQFLSDSLDGRPNINVVTIRVPSEDFGLPPDMDIQEAKTPQMQDQFLRACARLAPQTEAILHRLRPDCLVADMFFPWAIGIAAAFGIPTLIFEGTSFFAKCASLSVSRHRPQDCVSSDSEVFVVPDLPDAIELTKSRIPEYEKHDDDDGSELVKVFREKRKMEEISFGFLVNSFRELEGSYADCFRDVFGRRAWHIGPLFLHEKTSNSSDNEHREYLKWLDSKEPNSVIYVSFGSVEDIEDEQLVEIAAGLEASGKPFVWVVKRESGEEWLPKEFWERTKGRRLIVRGWAPQVAILEHEAVGGFVTHCGWNSILESVCSGVPMVTWPVSAEQFYNEKLVSQVLRIGVEVGAKKWKRLVGDFVGREAIEKAIRSVMEGDEAVEMRGRVRSLASAARDAAREGGSSMLDLDKLFQELRLTRIANDSN